MKRKKINYKKLMEKAKAAAGASRSPYSRFAVGSAVLCGSGRIYFGTNVENASYGLSNCAERSALFNAASNGESDIAAVAVWTKQGGVFPCGACRQVILELAPESEVVVNKDASADSVIVVSAADLLPFAFGAKKLKKK